MSVKIEMPEGFVGFAGGMCNYAFETREAAVKFMDPEGRIGNDYLEQDPDTGYWIWWMDFI
jgi:hypothetical protein